MANSTFIQVPPNVTDAAALKRFLEKLVLQLDVAFGNRGAGGFAPTITFQQGVLSIQDIAQAISKEAVMYSKLDGSRQYTDIVSYATDKTFTDGKELIAKKYADDTFEPMIATKGTAFNNNFGTSTGTVTEGGTTTNNPKQTAIADLNQTISATYTQAEVQAISDKIDDILGALRGANIV